MHSELYKGSLGRERFSVTPLSLSLRGNGSNRCNICNLSFFRKDSLLEHVEQKHVETWFQCLLCAAKLPTFRSFNEHQLLHGELSFYFCQWCRSQYSSKEHLEAHLSGHVQRESLCDVCKVFFPSRSALLRHQHLKCKGPNPCSSALRSLRARVIEEVCASDLAITHLNPKSGRHHKHSVEKLFFCKSCGKVHFDEKELMNHSKKREARMHQCDLCFLKYTSQNSLDRHRKLKHKNMTQNSAEQFECVDVCKVSP